MHTHTHSVPSGKPANKSSSRIAFSLACDFNAAAKLNVDPLMASRRWPMRRILYSWTYQHTLVRKGKRMERTHRHMHAHVERASETNPSSNQQHELVGSWGGGETLSAEIGPPPACGRANAWNAHIDTCMRMSNAQARPIPHPTNNTNMCWWDAEGERRLCLQR